MSLNERLELVDVIDDAMNGWYDYRRVHRNRNTANRQFRGFYSRDKEDTK